MARILYISWILIVIIFAWLMMKNSGSTGEEIGLAVALVFVGFPIYFLPSFIAAHRRVNQRIPLFVANLFFAGTGVGWIALIILALALGTEYDKPVTIRIVP